MKTRYTSKHLLLASSILALGLAASSGAKAAFEWTPPAEVAVEEKVAPDMVPAEDVLAPAPDEELPIIPADNMVEQEPEMAPVEYVPGEEPKDMMVTVPADSEVAEDLVDIIEEAEEKNVLTPVATIPESEQIDQIPEEDENVIVNVQDTPEIEQPMPEMQNEVMVEPNPDLVQGFGKDLPLITAVRQILPTNMPYAFGDNVDMSTPVSWEGGQTWQATIEEIAAANNLDVQYDNNVVKFVEQRDSGIETVRIESMPQEPMPMAEAEIMPEPAEPMMIDQNDPVVLQPAQAQMADNAGEELLSLEEVIRVADEEIKAAATISQETDLIVTEISEEDMNSAVDPMMAAEEMEQPMVIMEDAMAEENQVIEASIADAVVISPIENMESDMGAMTSMMEGQSDTLSEIQEGAVIGPIDEPMSAQMPSQDDLMVVASTMEPTPEAVAMQEEMVIVEENAMGEAEAAIMMEKTTIVMDEMDSADTMPMDNEIEMAEEIVVNQPVDPMPLQITEPVKQPMPAQEEAMPIQEQLNIVAAQNAAPQVMMMPEELNMVKTWKVKKNSDLKSTLEKWTQEAGIDLQWNMQQDYTVGYMVWVDGSFQEAVDVLMQGYNDDKGLIPSATLGQSATGQPVLIIEPAA